MRKGMRRKMKVYAVDAAMLFLAVQTTITFGSDRVQAETVRSSIEEEVQVTECDYKRERVAEGVEEKKTTLVHSRDWGADDAEILLQIAMAEAEGEGVEGKAYVMMVVLNRVWSEGFPGTIEEVVFQPGQFTPVKDGGRYWTVTPDEECYKAHEMILHGWDESEGALYFCTSGGSSWVEENTEYLYTIGNHNFYR